MFDEILQLKDLIEKTGVPIVFMAQLCQCSPKSIKNYITGDFAPNGTRLMAIREALKQYKELVNQIIKD